MMLILLPIRPVLDYDLDPEEPQIPPYHEVTNQNAMVPKKFDTTSGYGRDTALAWFLANRMMAKDHLQL